MTMRVIPGRAAVISVVAAALVVLIARLVGVPGSTVTGSTLAAIGALLAAALYDYRASIAAWRRATPVVTRRLPAAFAIGAERPVAVRIDTAGADSWRCSLYDHADASLRTTGLPIELALAAGTSVETSYSALPTRRGEVT